MLQNKNAIITGARRGIGRATVETFAGYGANVWACARKYDEAFDKEMCNISEKFGVKIWPLYFDVTDEEQVREAIQTIRKQSVPVDVLVNVAGIAEDSTSFQMTNMNKMRHVFDVNFFATTLVMQYVSRLMIRQNNGNIINIASIAGIDGTPAQYEYAASKAAVIGGTKELARELAKYNIRVNSVAPGIVDTDMGAQIAEKLRKEVVSKVILGRVGKPEEIANVVAFLASSLSNYMTGQVIRVDGGM
jgi:3-oxoacyl-[acyl-carrier protein] reductase